MQNRIPWSDPAGLLIGKVIPVTRQVMEWFGPLPGILGLSRQLLVSAGCFGPILASFDLCWLLLQQKDPSGYTGIAKPALFLAETFDTGSAQEKEEPNAPLADTEDETHKVGAGESTGSGRQTDNFFDLPNDRNQQK